MCKISHEFKPLQPTSKNERPPHVNYARLIIKLFKNKTIIVNSLNLLLHPGQGIDCSFDWQEPRYHSWELDAVEKKVIPRMPSRQRGFMQEDTRRGLCLSCEGHGIEKAAQSNPNQTKSCQLEGRYTVSTVRAQVRKLGNR